MAPAGDPGGPCASVQPPASCDAPLGHYGASACLSVLLSLTLPWAAVAACLSGRGPQPRAPTANPPGHGKGAPPARALPPAHDGTLSQGLLPPMTSLGSSPRFLSWENATWLLLLAMASVALLFPGSSASRGLLLLLALLLSQASVAWSCLSSRRLGLPLALTALAIAMLSAAFLPFHGTPFSRGSLETPLALLSVALLALVLLTCHPPGTSPTSVTSAKAPALAALEAQVEQLKAAAAAAAGAKVQFLGNMSHELRTPLHGILGMLDLALDDPGLSAEVREQLETVVQLANQLLVVVGDVLDMSKLEAGELSLEEEQFDLRGLVNATMTMLAVRAQAKGLGLTWVVDPGIPSRLWGDAVRLRQCLVNLVGNGLKYTHVGQVEVSVRVLRVGEEPLRMTPAPLLSTPPGHQGPLLSSVSAPSPKSRRAARQATSPSTGPAHPLGARPSSPLVRQGVSLDVDALRRCSLGKDEARGVHQALEDDDAGGEGATLLLFTIRDTGIGIAKSQQMQIFRAFEQADGSVSRAYGGAGLGLSISTRLVEMMGGRMWLTSELGKGSTFSFSVRLGTHSPDPEDAAADAAGPVPAHKSQASGGTTDSPKSPAPRRLSEAGVESRLESEALLSAFVLQRSCSRIPAPSPAPSSAPSEAGGAGEDGSLSPYGDAQVPAASRRASEPPISGTPLLQREGPGRHSSPMTPTAPPHPSALTPSRLFHAYSSGALASASPRPSRSQGPKTRHQSGSGIPPAPRGIPPQDMRQGSLLMTLISERSVGRILDGLVYAQGAGSASGRPRAGAGGAPEAGPAPGAGEGRGVGRPEGDTAGSGQTQQAIVEHAGQGASLAESLGSCGSSPASQKEAGRRHAPGGQGQEAEPSQAAPPDALQAAQLESLRSRQGAKERPPLAVKRKESREEASQGQEGALFSRVGSNYTVGARVASGTGIGLAVLREAGALEETEISPSASGSTGTTADAEGEGAPAEGTSGEAIGSEEDGLPRVLDSMASTRVEQRQRPAGQEPAGFEGTAPGQRQSGPACTSDKPQRGSRQGAPPESGARQEDRQDVACPVLGSSGASSAARQQVRRTNAGAGEAEMPALLSLDDVYSRIVMSSLSPRGGSSREGASRGPSWMQAKALEGERGDPGSLRSEPMALPSRAVKEQLPEQPKCASGGAPPLAPGMDSSSSTTRGPRPRSGAAQEAGAHSSMRRSAEWRQHEAQDVALAMAASATFCGAPAPGPRGPSPPAQPAAEAVPAERAATGPGAGAGTHEPGSSPGARCLPLSETAEGVPRQGYVASGRDASFHPHPPLGPQRSGERDRLRRQASAERHKGRRWQGPAEGPASNKGSDGEQSGTPNPIGADAAPVAPPSRAGPGEGGPSAPRVLVVDDSAINQKVALRFLKKYGLPAEAVGDGMQALHRLYPLMARASALSTDTGQSACELTGEGSRKGGHTSVRGPSPGSDSGAGGEASASKVSAPDASGSPSLSGAEGAPGPEDPPPFDVVLLDIQMPVLDGMETVRRIRAREHMSGHRHLPVIGLTAHAAKEYRERSIAAGMDEFVSKVRPVKTVVPCSA